MIPIPVLNVDIVYTRARRNEGRHNQIPVAYAANVGVEYYVRAVLFKVIKPYALARFVKVSRDFKYPYILSREFMQNAQLLEQLDCKHSRLFGVRPVATVKLYKRVKAVVKHVGNGFFYGKRHSVIE